MRDGSDAPVQSLGEQRGTARPARATAVASSGLTQRQLRDPTRLGDSIPVDPCRPLLSFRSHRAESTRSDGSPPTPCLSTDRAVSTEYRPRRHVSC